MVNNSKVVYKYTLKSVVINYEFNYFSTYLLMKDQDEYCERFEFLIVVTAVKVSVVWDVIPCSLTAVY